MCPAEAHVELLEFGKFGKGLGSGVVFDADAAVKVEGFQFGHVLDVADGLFDLVVLAEVEVPESGKALERFEALVIEGSPGARKVEAAEGGFVGELFEALPVKSRQLVRSSSSKRWFWM